MLPFSDRAFGSAVITIRIIFINHTRVTIVLTQTEEGLQLDPTSAAVCVAQLTFFNSIIRERLFSITPRRATNLGGFLQLVPSLGGKWSDQEVTPMACLEK